MTVRSTRRDGSVGPETVARMSVRDICVLGVALVGFGLALGAIYTKIDVLGHKIDDLDNRVGRIETHEDGGWSK